MPISFWDPSTECVKRGRGMTDFSYKHAQKYIVVTVIQYIFLLYSQRKTRNLIGQLVIHTNPYWTTKKHIGPENRKVYFN